MKRIIVAMSVAALLVAGLLVTGAAAGEDRDALPGAEGAGWGCPYLPGGSTGTLNLTADQQKKLADLQEKFFEANDKISDSIVAKERETRKLYLTEKLDIKAIDKAQDEIRALADKRVLLSRDFRDKARALLTADQLKANPYAFVMMGPGFGGGFGPGMMGPGFGGGCGRGWDGDRDRGGWFHTWWRHHRR